MAHLIDKDAVVAEIEKLKGQLLRGACSSQISMQTRCKEESYDEVLALLDTIQEESVSEDLEEAAEQYAKDYLFTATPTRSLTDHFKAGANWQKQQTIDKAAEWLSELDDALFLGYDNDGYPYIGRGGLVRDFKKYMED